MPVSKITMEMWLSELEHLSGINQEALKKLQKKVEKGEDKRRSKLGGRK